MITSLTVSLLLISESLCQCSPGITDISRKLESRGFISSDTGRQMRYLTLQVCADPEPRRVARWHELFAWRARLIPNREIEREYSRVVEETHEHLRRTQARKGKR